jgi:hypothetical protein
MKSFYKYLCLAAICISATESNATIEVFTDRAAFMAAISTPAIDTYSDFSPGDVYRVIGMPPITPFHRTIGNYEYEAWPGFKNFFFGGTAGDIRLVSGQSLTVDNFSGSPYAIGADIFGADVVLPGFCCSWAGHLTNAAGEVADYSVPKASVFLGFVSFDAPIVSLGVSPGISGNIVVSNLTLGSLAVNVVPELPPVLLFGAGVGPLLLVIGNVRRRANRFSAIAKG